LLFNKQRFTLKPLLTFVLFFLVYATDTFADSNPSEPTPAPVVESDAGHYLLAPGDMLEISVWKEEGMQQQQILVAPDGKINFPLAGTIMAAGKPLFAVEDAIAAKLANYIADPVVNVKLMHNSGNTIFVIGKVNKPGQYPANRKIDVLQALSLAGGLTVFADEDSIHVLRRVGNQVIVFPFDYEDVLKGKHLEQNIILEAGDTVTVP
jgi:polysaccharide biosynthesis/export protein